MHLMEARGALAKPTARSSLTNVFGFFIGFWEGRRMNVMLRATVNCERDLLWDGIGRGSRFS
jgi:hypothetical protein